MAHTIPLGLLALAAQALGAASLCIVLIVLCRAYARPFLTHWAWGWAAGAIAAAVAAGGLLVTDLPASAPERLSLLAVATVASYLQLGWMLMGAETVVSGSRWPAARQAPYLLVLAALGLASVLAAPLADTAEASAVRYLVRVGLRSAAGLLAFGIAAVAVFRSRREGVRVGPAVVSGALVALAVLHGVTLVSGLVPERLVVGSIALQLVPPLVGFAACAVAGVKALGVAGWMLEEQQARLGVSARLEQQAQSALRESELRYRTLVESTTAAVFVCVQDCIRDVNRAAEALTGYPRDRLLRMQLSDLLPPAERQTLLDRAGDVVAAMPVEPQLEATLRGARGLELTVLLSTAAITYDGQPALLVTAFDMTERRLAEEEQRRAQKLELVARMAEGLAHDLSNVLTVVRGYADLLAERAHGAPSRDVVEIRRAADRGLELTAQILAFGQRGPGAAARINLSGVVRTLEPLLRRVVGPDVRVVLDLSPQLPLVKADPADLEQAVLQITDNARNAMPAGGTLTVVTGEVMLPADPGRRHGPRDGGHYATLRVSDTGVGMDVETRRYLFEPFFTKRRTRGAAGLGLASAAATVRRWGGHIFVESEPGLGSTLLIYLPVAPAELAADASSLPVGVPETIPPATVRQTIGSKEG